MPDRRLASPLSSPDVSVGTGDPPSSRRSGLGLLLLIGGLVGLAAAFVLTVEKFALLADPTYTPSCSINPILSCGSVMSTPQAEVFGFPNPLLGIVGFTAVTVTGAAVLGGARLPRWYRYGLLAGATFGVVFVHWLAYQSLYRIGALCPYCMVVWAVTIPIFWYLALDTLAGSTGARGSRRLVARAQEFHGVVLTVWILTIVLAIAARFWTSWVALW